MCATCPTESLEKRTPPRRELPMGAARADPSGAIGDLVHEPDEGFPTLGDEPRFAARRLTRLDPDGHDIFEPTVGEHTGTRMDTPLRFGEDGASVAKIPIASRVRPLRVVDIRDKAASDADATVVVGAPEHRGGTGCPARTLAPG